MAITRRKALALGVAPGLMAGVACQGTAFAAPTHPGFVLAPDLGIAPGNTASANRSGLLAALSGSAVCVVFPPGDYLVDNSGTHVVIGNYRGELVMQPGARFVFTDNTLSGLIFEGGDGARLHGLTTAFVSQPTSRKAAEECVLFRRTNDSYVANVRVDGSAAAGLLFWQCVRPTVVGAFIANTMADGLTFTNCRDARADRITTVDTGDDGLAFGNIASGPDHTGALATNISVTRSKSRGVAVTGQSGVTVRDVTVNDTVGHGLYCAYELAWNTRVPNDVRFERARVVRGGAWVAGGANGTNSGVRVSGAGAVSIAGATVEDSAAQGVFVSGSTATLVDVTVRNSSGTPGTGFNLQGSTCVVDRLIAENINGIGLYAAGCDRLEYGTITVRSAARTHSTRRAVNIENVAYVFGERLWVHDPQQAATGYVVRAAGTQLGSLGVLVDLVHSRDVVVENPSGLSYSRS